MKELAGLMFYLTGLTLSFIGLSTSKSRGFGFIWSVSLITQFVFVCIYYVENFG